jgi:hypothetical protein
VRFREQPEPLVLDEGDEAPPAGAGSVSPPTADHRGGPQPAGADSDRAAATCRRPSSQDGLPRCATPGRPIGPGPAGDRPLPGHGRGHRVAGLREGHEESVAFGADLVAVKLGEGGSKQPPVRSQDLDIPVTQPLQRPGGTLDVGEQQQGDRPGRQVRHDAPPSLRIRASRVVVRSTLDPKSSEESSAPMAWWVAGEAPSIRGAATPARRRPQTTDVPARRHGGWR